MHVVVDISKMVSPELKKDDIRLYLEHTKGNLQ